MVPSHKSSHLFDKSCKSTLKIESSLVTLLFLDHNNPRPLINVFMISELSEIKGLHIKSKKFSEVNHSIKRELVQVFSAMLISEFFANSLTYAIRIVSEGDVYNC